MTTAVLLSTECVNDWHDDCRIGGCACDCHSGAVPATPNPPAPRPRLSASRERVYAAIVDYHRDHGHAPSVRELSAAVGLGTGTVNYHLRVLDATGRVSLRRGHARTVVPIREPLLLTHSTRAVSAA